MEKLQISYDCMLGCSAILLGLIYGLDLDYI